jgi:superfamily I DNA/RNA helicase
MTHKTPIVWSEYQKKIFYEIAKGTQNVIVLARAGASKTSSLVEGSKYIPKGQTALFCAFNKSIQEELKKKLKFGVECLTLHSLGLRGIKNRFPGIQVDNRKCWDIVESLFDKPKENYDLIENIVKTVDFCKATLVDTPSKIESLILDIDIDLCGEEMKSFISYVSSVLRKCKEDTSRIDFNDMIWFPFIYKINVGTFQNVYLDEAQDCNRAQIELALSAVASGGRVFAVMDNFQAIYSWRGADVNILDTFRERLNPKELSLPICYRCPKKVVALAKQFAEDILPFEHSKDGEIINLQINDLIKHAKAGSFVLSRVNAPLIRLCLVFLKNKIPANILGRDVGDGLKYLIKKSKKKNLKAFLNWLNKWKIEEKAKRLEKYPNASTETIDDKFECLMNLCEDATTLEEVKQNIDSLFKDNDKSKIVLFSSIHRAKGSEANDVFVLCDTLRNSTQEEKNIKYVSLSRARERLFLVRKELPPNDEIYI